MCSGYSCIAMILALDGPCLSFVSEVVCAYLIVDYNFCINRE